MTDPQTDTLTDNKGRYRQANLIYVQIYSAPTPFNK